MIPTDPPPGILPPPRGPFAWLGHQIVRLRWEIAPLGAATVCGIAVEAYAATSPGWEEPTGAAITAALLAGIAVPVKGISEAGAWACGAGAAACAWSSWQFLAPSFGGVLVGAIVATVGSVPYWRFVAARRDKAREEATAVQIETLRAQSRTAMAFPAPRQAPAIETVDEPEAGELPVVPWPGAPTGLSITDPIALSPTTSITLPGGHVLVGGGTDMGKSGIIHNICCNVISRPDARLLVIDMKPGAVELGIYGHAGARVASTAKAALRLLEDVSEEGRRRGSRLGASTSPDGDITLTRTWTPTPDDPHWVVVIDELAELVDAAPEAADLLRSHTRLLRALGVTVVSGCQITSRRVFGGDTDGRGQYGTRICVRVFEPGQTGMIMGQGAHGAGIRPDRLTQPGEFLIVGRRHNGLSPDRAYLLTNEAIAGHVRRHATGATAMPQKTEPAAFTAASEPAFESSGSTTQDILTYLREHTAAPKDVAAAISGNKDSVRAIMSKLARDGHLTALGDGRYRATKRGETLVGNVVRFPGKRNA